MMEVGSSSREILDPKKDHVAIDIVHEENLAYLIKEKMDSISPSHCVCRVPEQLFKEYREYYFPSTVSIGPFHRHKVEAMEEKKWCYFDTLLSRNHKAEETLDSCIKAVRHVEKQARKFYGQTVDMGSDEFVEMLLVDGCFIIELLLEYAIKSLRRRDDPIFSTNDTIYGIRRDLILLENQVPFFILERLFHLVPIPTQCQLSLVELALCFFKNILSMHDEHIPREKYDPKIHHLLDLIRQHYLPTSPEVLSNVQHEHKNLPHHAIHLVDIGASLKPMISEESPLNINFLDGELKIPPLKIDGYTEILFRNLIAMELCCHELPKHVASYAVFMKRLLRYKRDVRLCQMKKILIDGCGREGQIVGLFKRLCVDVDIDNTNFSYNEICERIHGYEANSKQVWWKRLRHSYHRTHAGVASLSVVLLLLVFLFTGKTKEVHQLMDDD
ncbi:UPF0481 protein At3g47200-like isoform X2 [Henckelia pumila]|uniref:UPF0481 protein At3g47200-like isoform X2 n=1 Tax=Henckelia pumila TaxID=405737 RepID=UPI003C6DF383